MSSYNRIFNGITTALRQRIEIDTYWVSGPIISTMRALMIFVLVLLVQACASPEMVAPGDESTARSRISPAAAMRLAAPHLESVFRRRCEKRLDRHWCDKPARDHVLVLGDHYHVTRESYPYKTIQAYVKPAVRVHRETGEISFAD
jgi:hypothetical protein